MVSLEGGAAETRVYVRSCGVLRGICQGLLRGRSVCEKHAAAAAGADGAGAGAGAGKGEAAGVVASSDPFVK